MVYLLVLISILFQAAVAQASQLDDFLGPSDPAYYQKIAPRFIDWIENEFSDASNANRMEALKIIRSQTKNLKNWSFSPTGVSWPRLQFGAGFKATKKVSGLLSIFPDDAADLRKKILESKLDTRPPSKELQDLIGFGYDLKTGETAFYYQEILGPNFQVNGFKLKTNQAVKKVTFLARNMTSSIKLVSIEPPEDSDLAFAPMVRNWSLWIFDDGKAHSYEIDLLRFNLRLLDGAAIPLAKKINLEFLLSNLRIGYKANDDYQILYP
jgi:hypothetical protein